MSDYEDKEEKRLLSILDQFSDEFIDEIGDRAKLCAVNFILQVGAKMTLSADGYLAAGVQIASATIVKLIDEGFIELRPNATASEDIVSERQKKRAEYLERKTSNPGVAEALELSRASGQYL